MDSVGCIGTDGSFLFLFFMFEALPMELSVWEHMKIRPTLIWEAPVEML
jgi:hypothetical protein